MCLSFLLGCRLIVVFLRPRATWSKEETLQTGKLDKAGVLFHLRRRKQECIFPLFQAFCLEVKALAAAGLDVLKVRNKSGQSAEQLARERCKEKTLSRGPRCKLQKSRIV